VLNVLGHKGTKKSLTFFVEKKQLRILHFFY